MKEVRIYRDCDGDLAYGDESKASIFFHKRVRPERVVDAAKEKLLHRQHVDDIPEAKLVLIVRLKK